MGKGNNAYQISAWTTGSGIAVATNCDFGGVWVGSAATTITLKVGTADFLVVSGANAVLGSIGDGPIAVSGALNGTSSGGSFAVIYRKK
jgi:hypothetical protein